MEGAFNNEDEYRSSIPEEESRQMEAAGSAVKRRREEAHFGEKLQHRHRAQSIIQSKALDELEKEVLETGLYENVDLHCGSTTSVLLAEIAYGYLWWSVMFALMPAIWFYPLCALEISGYEVICILWFSPLVTLIGPIRRAVATPLGLLVLRLLSLVGVASYQAPTTLSRLIVLGVGNFFNNLVLCGAWWGMSKLDRHRYIYCHMLGFLLMLAVRTWWTSFDPIFMDITYNKIAIGSGIILSVYLYFNNWRTPVVDSDDDSSKPPPGDSRYPGLLATGMGFGALLFLTLYLFGDIVVLSRWAVEPYPYYGPSPYPWSVATMLALTTGLVIFGHQKDLLSSLGWLIIGLSNAMVLYFMHSYIAFFGGLILAIYTTSIWPHLVKRVVLYPAGKVLSLAVLSLILHIVLSAWVVAYNFVPGGAYTRERTDILLVITIVLIGAACRDKGTKDSKERTKDHSGKLQVAFLGRVFRRLSTISEEMELPVSSEVADGSVHAKRTKEVARAEEREYQEFHSKVMKAAVLIFLFTSLGFVYRYQPLPGMPEKERPEVFSAGIWAFHFGYDNDGYPSMERAAQLIENTDVDVIGLLETDAARPYIGNHDIASWLSERLHVHADYGPGTKDHTWGAMLLSKYPIVKSEHFLLPSPEGELAPALLASINISGRIVDVYCVHFGNDIDVLDRKLQAEKSAEILSNTTNPVVMISYITNKPGSRDYNRIRDSGRVKDIDPTDKHRWCEYIFYRGVVRLGYARISHGGLSDTEVQIGKFRIPDDVGEPDNEILTQDPQKVPEWTHFPDKFGNLYRGHFADQSQHHFHMGTPKYFRQQ